MNEPKHLQKVHDAYKWLDNVEAEHVVDLRNVGHQKL